MTFFLFSGVTAPLKMFSNSDLENSPPRASIIPSLVETLIPLFQYPETRAKNVASNFSSPRLSLIQVATRTAYFHDKFLLRVPSDLGDLHVTMELGSLSAGSLSNPAISPSYHYLASRMLPWLLESVPRDFLRRLVLRPERMG